MSEVTNEVQNAEATEKEVETVSQGEASSEPATAAGEAEGSEVSAPAEGNDKPAEDAAEESPAGDSTGEDPQETQG